MDDLAGLDWSKSTSSQKPAQPTYTLGSSLSSLKPTPPVSGRATPLSSAVSPKPPSKPATPAPGNDSFANLVSWSSNPSNANLSLQEQQKRLADLKLQQQSKVQSSWASNDDAAWNNLGSGRSTPALQQQQNGKAAPASIEKDEDDMFAAFNAPKAAAAKPVVKSPSPPVKNVQMPDEDDDPFGLAEFQQKKPQRTETVSTFQGDDDDVLGLLGKPVDRSQKRPEEDTARRKKPVSDEHPQDRAVADLVDMGFPAEKARMALETTDSGTDVQAAVSYLLNAAHTEARERSQSRDTSRNGHMDEVPMRGRGGHAKQAGRQRTHVEDDDGPVMHRRQQQSSQPEKDPSQMAAEFGSSFLKTAGSLWKQGQKRVQQAVQEFNSDNEGGGGGQPKWMRDAERREAQEQEESTGRRRRRSSAGKKKAVDATDEAMMLESQRPTPPPSRQTQRRPEPRFDTGADSSRDHSPAVPSRLREGSSPQPAFLRQQQPKPSPQPPPSRTTLSRQANEDQAAQAYVSSARRRKPAAPAPSASEPDLFDSTPSAQPPPRPQSSRPAQPPANPKPTPKATPIPSRPPPPTRTLPTIPPLSLKASHTARLAGNAHFKRGDYSSAHTSYSTSLTHLPATHTLTLPLLTNRALTALKTGEPRLALSDADRALTLIGPSKGEAESIDFLDGSNEAKAMREYYGKALMRKAEALEQLEKWSDAAAVWREAVEGGHGGATSMQGRLRAEKAANPAPKPTAAAAVRKAPAVKPAASAVPRRPAAATRPAGDSAAVSALRAANAAADKADDERFALSDSVSARIDGWKTGKEGNLRALLASLDTVLWQGANWKKVGMGELVVPGKVKVVYMRGIGRVHPDKIPTDATTEQRMISAAVFSQLNEAWDRFKAENGL